MSAPDRDSDRSNRLKAWAIEANRRRLYERVAPSRMSEFRRRRISLLNGHGTIKWDKSVRIQHGFSLMMPGPGELIIGPHVEIRRGVRIEMEHHSRVVIGERTVLGYGMVIQATQEIVIGSGCLFAAGASIVDSKHSFRDLERPLHDQPLEYAPLHIGDDVWVSSKATIAADVGDRAVIGAHAVVTRPIDAYTVAVGTPARPVEYFGP